MVQIGTQTASVINNIDHLSGDLNISDNTFNLSVQIHEAKQELLREVDRLTSTITQNPNIPQEIKDTMNQGGANLKQAVDQTTEATTDHTLLSTFESYAKMLKGYTKTIVELAPTIKTLIAVGKGVGALIALTV